MEGHAAQTNDDIVRESNASYDIHRYVNPQENIASLEFLYVKELVYVVLVFLACARVNEKSEELTKNICDHICAKDLPVHPYLYASAHPISYKLFYVRVTKRNLLLQMLLFVVALAIGAAKTLIVNMPVGDLRV